MTLALYGKSRRRRGALLAAALLAVLIATIGALVAITPGGAKSGGGNNQGGGNENCPEKYPVLVDKFDWKDTAYNHSPGDVPGQQVTIRQGTPTYVSWESTYPIGAIVVKGSTDAKTILLDPAPAWSGSFNNSGLTNPGGQTPDISNVKFCGNLIPTVTKVPAKGNPVDEPGQVIWTVTVKNPSNTGAIDHAVRIKDENVTVTSGPTYTGEAGCEPDSDQKFEQALNSTKGVDCTLPVGSSISFNVVPVQEPKQTCEPQKFRNSASVLLEAYRRVDEKHSGDTTKDWKVVAAAGSEITLNPAKNCDPVVIQKSVTFSKYICESFKDVPANQKGGVGPDDTGEPVYPAGGQSSLLGPVFPPGESDPTVPRDPEPCKLATTPWTFNLWTQDRFAGSGGTQLQTFAVTGSAAVPLADDVIKRLLNKEWIYVEEVYQPGYAFGALKCYTDHLGDDNREWLWPEILDAKDPVHCIAYNVPATKTITLVKTFYGVTQVSDGDYPTFTISDLPDWTMDGNCTGPVITGTGIEPKVATWTCTVPYSWNGTVTETPATGWEACKITAQVAADFGFTNCKRPSIVVKKVVTNVTNDTTQFTVTLTGGQSSETGQIAEWNGSAPVNAPFNNDLSVFNNYTVTEQPQNGYQVLGWAYANNDGTCPERPTSTSGDASAEVGYLSAGETKTICFYNERFGNVVVDKQAPTGAVTPGTTFNWTISVSVANGPTSSALSLTDTLPSGFTYGTPTATSPLSCSLNTTTRELTCTLPENTPAGTYTVTIPATVPTNDFSVCGETTNTVAFSGAGLEGEQTDSAAVTIGCVASDGRILVRKVVKGQPGDTTSFTAELTGPGITGTATQPFSQQTLGFFPGLSAGTFTVGEQPKPGYAYLGWAYGTISGDSVTCPANPTGTGNASATLSNVSPQAAICFYNQPRVTIRVHKILNIVGFTSDGQGWEFTLTGCGITPQTKTTGADGIAEFTDLPPAIGCQYTVTETVQSGWTPQFVSQTAQPVAGGQVVTLEFLNIRNSDPPCVDPNDPRCVPPPPSTPTPTLTPTTPTTTTTPTNTPTATPTNTPTPTPTNTPVTQVAGERTPGPGTGVVGVATPLAPSTGTGLVDTRGGVNLLLVLAGLVSLSLGPALVALGRRTDR